MRIKFYYDPYYDQFWLHYNSMVLYNGKYTVDKTNSDLCGTRLVLIGYL